MPVPESYRVDMGRCVCGAVLTPAGYRDRDAYRDAFVTSLCQACQDRVYLGVDQEEGLALPIVDGALVAVRAPGPVAELALLPFRLVLPGSSRAQLVWEARYIMRAGPWLDPLDLAYEFDPMAGLLLGHQVRMSEHRAIDAPEVTERLAGLQVVIGLDQHSLDAAAAVCPIPNGISRASLAEEVPWIDVFGRPLRPLDTWTGPEPKPLSTLRIAAVMGLLLMEQGRDRLRPLDRLVAPRAALFMEHFDGQA